MNSKRYLTSVGVLMGFFMVAAFAHVFSHAAFKSTLFANAAALHEQVGTLDMTKMGGLEKQMPKTSFCSVIAFLSTAGIPPLAGFWSKLLILIALWQAGSRGLAGAALIAGILTAAYFLRMQKLVFFGKPREELAEVREIGGTVLAAELLLTAITVGVGLLYPFLILYLHGRGIL